MIKLFTKKRKGFTLIELVVVIAILGILAAIAIPRFVGTQNKARLAADDATARVIQSAVSLYMAENGTKPDVAALINGDKYLKADELKWANGEKITEITVDDAGTVTGYTPPKPTY